MARFSLGGEEEDNSGEGPSSPKRLKSHLYATEFRPGPGPGPEPEPEEDVDEDDDEEEDDEEIEEEEEEEVYEEEEEEMEQVVVIEEFEGNSSGGDGSIRVILTDPDVLDCPICLEPFTIPVFQCENGHVACACCCGKIRNKCPSCCLPIGYNRCRGLEKVLESVKVACRNSMYGCKESVHYNKKQEHDKACTYAPCSCPLSSCNFIGSSKCLYRHFTTKHPSCATHFCFDETFLVAFETNERYVILQEMCSEAIFILNQSVVDRVGNAVNVSCMQSPWEKGFSYKLVARQQGGGSSSVRLHHSTHNITKLCRVNNNNAHKGAFLLVPPDFVASPITLQVLICNQDSAALSSCGD